MSRQRRKQYATELESRCRTLQATNGDLQGMARYTPPPAVVFLVHRAAKRPSAPHCVLHPLQRASENARSAAWDTALRQ